ncbi:MAG: hypothetical protein AAF328_10155 [Planctomycetota bacterium]
MQITQSGNGFTTSLVNNLDADLTGDGSADVTITGVSGSYLPGSFEAKNFLLYATIDGNDYSSVGGTDLGGNTASGPGVSDPQALGTSSSISHFFPIVFSDAAYGLTDEDGWVEVFVRADSEAPDDTGIFIRRLVFDPEQRGTPGFDGNVSYPEAMVPEPSAGLAVASVVGYALRRRR